MGAEKALQAFLIEGAKRGVFSSVHDCAAGGVAVALAESALAGGVGFSVTLEQGESHRMLFSETPRAVISCSSEKVEQVRQLADDYGVPIHTAGTVSGDVLDLGTFRVPLEVAKDMFEGVFERSLRATVA